MKICHCGKQKEYQHCCGAYILDNIPAPTPETLMRSRYSAFVEQDLDYLNKTMTLAPFEKKSIVQGKEQWLGLEVLQSFMHAEDPNIGYVEFRAKYAKPSGKIHIIQELSEFHFTDGRWYYVAGVHHGT